MLLLEAGVESQPRCTQYKNVAMWSDDMKSGNWWPSIIKIGAASNDKGYGE